MAGGTAPRGECDAPRAPRAADKRYTIEIQGKFYEPKDRKKLSTGAHFLRRAALLARCSRRGLAAASFGNSLFAGKLCLTGLSDCEFASLMTRMSFAQISPIQ